MTKRERLPASSEWTFPLIEQYHEAIRKTAVEDFGLDVYTPQLEIITSEQMMDAYASVGMPVNYRHWSYGKEFITTEKNYKRGAMGLAYEIVINSDPCIAYLMEENTMAMQALVIAHAAYGHNSFFKGNYLFRQWTDASGIVDYLVFAKNKITEYEERYGLEAVEAILDSCHALMNYGVDRYKHPRKLSLAESEERRRDREAYDQRQLNELWRVTAPDFGRRATDEEEKRFPPEPEENLLYFIEKNAPLLEKWQREVVRIVRKIAQYFYPQRQTQVMNEGWATFWHHKILHTMDENDQLDPGMMIEWMKSHTNVIYQPPVGSKHYSGINPYALGFAMYTDIKRICEGGHWHGSGEFIKSDSTQLAEDKEWFPEIAGKGNWLDVLKGAMRDYKDESFISQHLSPRLMREFRLFSVLDDEDERELVVGPIHDELGYRNLRELFSAQYNLNEREPNIQVYAVNRRSDRSLILRHRRSNGRPLHDSAQEVLKHVARLWGFPVYLESIEDNGQIRQKFECKPPERKD